MSDRATALHFWAMHKRQICWAHLLRKFVSFSERAGPATAIGDELRALVAPLRTQFEAALARAAATDIKGVTGSCADILEHEQALWTFIDHDHVEPTNNHAERELRRFVLWRKRSFGTQSERGNRFAERLMTVAHTARKQHKNVLIFLTACCTAARSGERAPSLFAA